MHDEAPACRAATRDDLPAVEALVREAQLPTAGLDALFAADASQCLVMDDRDDPGRLVAAAAVEVCADDGLLRSVVVRADRQQRGVGQHLVAQALREAQRRGLRGLYLLTVTAEHYFPRFGFARIERGDVPPAVAATVEFVSACPASAVAMRAELTPSDRYTAPVR